MSHLFVVIMSPSDLPQGKQEPVVNRRGFSAMIPLVVDGKEEKKKKKKESALARTLKDV